MNRYLVALVAGLALPLAAAAQATGVVTGTVTDASTGRPIAGAQVFQSGTTRAAVTDQQGRYRLPNVPAGRAELRASYPGYAQGTRAVTVAAGATVTVDFALQPSAVELDVLVVNPITGQLERRRELGTNTTTITVEQLQRAPVTRAADALAARAPGVILNYGSGSTGTSQRIRIRGANSLSLSNDPLIFVDGIQVSNSKGGFGVGGQGYSRLDDINPNDIESVEIIRGPAATALYGTAGANGVVQIRTKRGRAGSTRWTGWFETGSLKDVTNWPTNYLTYQVIGNPANPLYIENQVNRTVAFNTTDYRRCRNFEAAEGLCVQQATISRNPLKDPVTTPFSTGRRYTSGLSAAGGGERVTYYLSLERDDERSVLEWNRLGRNTYRVNIGAQVTPKLSVQVNTNYINSDLSLNGNDNNVFSPIINGLLGRPQAFPSLDSIATPGGRPSYGFGYAPNDLRLWFANQTVDRYILGSNAAWRPFGWLQVNAIAGLDFFSRHDNQTIQPNYFPLSAAYIAGFRASQRLNNYIYSLQTSASATFRLGESLTSTTTVGSDWKREFNEFTYCYGQGLLPGTSTCATTTSNFAVDESRTESRTIGLLARQQFNWRDRWFLALSLRGDNTSAAGADIGFQTYPGVNLSWVVSEEPWFPQNPVISLLRLRTAYGESGNRPGTRDPLTLLSRAAVEVGTAQETGFILSNIGNPNLRAERTREIEGGFDLGLFDDRVSVDFTAYRKRTTDMLVARPLPPSFGLTGPGSQFQNLASMRNTGTELGVNARVLDRRNLALNLRLSAGTLHNKLEDLGPGVAPIAFNRGNQRHQPGFPAGAFFRTPYVYNDANGDGKLSRNEVQIDRTKTIRSPTGLPGDTVDLNLEYVGPMLPTNTQSLSADLTLFNTISVYTLFERRAGQKTVNFTEYFRCVTLNGRAAAQGFGGCRATDDPTAPLAEQARFIAAQFLGLASQAYIEDADFVKWRELTVSFSLPQSLVRRFGRVQGVSINLSGRNLRTWTKYSGTDPEISETGATAEFTQGEFNTQPPPRIFLIRVNLNF